MQLKASLLLFNEEHLKKRRRKLRSNAVNYDGHPKIKKEHDSNGRKENVVAHLVLWECITSAGSPCGPYGAEQGGKEQRAIQEVFKHLFLYLLYIS